MSDKRVELFTDGACKGNPGPGGWGVLLRAQRDGVTHQKELWGGEVFTTNNRMELLAVIRGLEALNRPCQVRITTDSQYVQKGVQEWLAGWKARNWQTRDKKPVKNADLWQHLDQVLAPHQVDWQWVRGHTGHAENEWADQLANRGVAAVLNGVAAPATASAADSAANAGQTNRTNT